MKIANADKLIHHFENVVDVKLFTPAQIITIIERFSSDVSEGHELVFHQEENLDIIVTDLEEKRKLDSIIGGSKYDTQTS